MSSLGARITGSPDGPGDLIASRGHRRDSAVIMHQCIRPAGSTLAGFGHEAPAEGSPRRHLRDHRETASQDGGGPLSGRGRPQERPSELPDRILWRPFHRCEFGYDRLPFPGILAAELAKAGVKVIGPELAVECMRLVPTIPQISPAPGCADQKSPPG